MNILEAIQTSGKSKGPGCSLGRVLEELSNTERADLQTCLDDKRYTHAQIARGLAHIGHKVDQGTVGRHRTHDCSCPKPTC